jgi:AAA family ATP:ADP antiporter
MLSRLRQFFDIRAGEGGPLLICALYVAVAVATFLLAKPIRNGLFLAQFGAYKLVYAYVAVPVVLSLFIPIYNAIAARIGQRLVITGSLLFLCSNVLTFWWLLRHHPAPWIAAAFYVWVNCYGVIAPVQAWTFANAVFDTRQARRLFGLVGAGASLGAILGGLIASLLVAPMGGAVNLLLVLALLIAAAAVIVNVGWRARRRDLRPPRRSPARFGQTLALIGRSRYLRLIAALVFLVAVVTQWTQFQFSLTAETQFAGDADRLTVFFGRFNFWLGVVAFVLQLFLTGPALRNFGITFTILLLPLALGFGSALIILWPSLWSVMLTNGFDQGLRFSVDKATFELLYVPVDARVKNSVKAAIDLVINRVADGVGGVLLGLATQGFSLVMFTLPGAGLGIRGIAACSLVGIGAWMIVANALRQGYVAQIRDSIHQNRLETERATTALDRSALDVLNAKIRSGDPSDVLYALELFSAQHRGALHPVARGLITHPEPRVRCRAVEILDEAGDRGSARQIEGLLRDPDLETRTAALLFLAHHAGIDPLQRIRELGNFEDFSIQAATIAFLSRPGDSQNLEAARVFLEAMRDEPGDGGRRPRLEAARLLGRLPNAFPDVLDALLLDSNPEVAREAIVSAGRLRAGHLTPALVRSMAQPALREAAADALATIGRDAVRPLTDALMDTTIPVDARCDIPLVLARIGTPDAQDALMTCLLQVDVSLRFRVIQGLNRLRELHPDMPIDRQSVEMVLGAEIMGHYRSYQVLGTVKDAFDGDDPVLAGLKESMQQEKERIFRLMGLLWPEFDLKSVWVGLQSESGAIRANALELLDSELSPELRRLVVPLFDRQVSVAERIRIANRVVGAEVESREEAVATLLASEDNWLKACGAYAVGQLRLVRLSEELAKLVDSPDPLIRETVRAALARLKEPVEEAHEAAVVEEQPAWDDVHQGQAGFG